MYIATTKKAGSLLNTHGDIFTREFLINQRKAAYNAHWVSKVVSLLGGKEWDNLVHFKTIFFSLS